MRMATRGWTSSAASSEAQVLRVPWTVIRGTLAVMMHRSKLRLKLRGSIGVPYRVVKTRPVSIQPSPARSRSASRCFLRILSAATQIRQRQRCLGCLGLDLAADELVPDSLELFCHVQLGLVQVDLFPGQAENFASSQAEDEDQDEGGIEGFACVPGRFEEPAGVIDSPGLALAAMSGLAAFDHLDSGGRVTGDCLVYNCAR